MKMPITKTDRWVSEPPPIRKFANNLGMRAVGRVSVWLNAFLGSRAEGTMGILMYHRVAPYVAGLPAPLHNVRPRRFREQLRGLQRRGFSFWPLSKALDFHSRGERIPDNTILVTFDDGFQTVYSEAWPVLKELEIPATVFVNTAFLDSQESFPFDAWGVACRDRAPAASYQPLTTEQCREMLDSGLVEIGAHTHTHEDFRGRPAEFLDDAKTSVDIVRTRFDVAHVTFAFPYGGRAAGFVSDELVDAARKAGAVCGLTTQSAVVSPGVDPFFWGRFNAFPWDTSATLAAKMGGWYSWAPELKQRIVRALSRGKRVAAQERLPIVVPKGAKG